MAPGAAEVLFVNTRHADVEKGNGPVVQLGVGAPEALVTSSAPAEFEDDKPVVHEAFPECS